MMLLRIAASATVFTLLSAVAAAAKPNETKPVETSADTNLRAAPGTAGEVLVLIPKGTTVQVGACSNGWCQVSLNGQEGFAVAQNLGMAPMHKAERRGSAVVDDEVEELGPPVYAPVYVAGPPVYYGYGYGPYFGFYGGWGFRHGWVRRW
jgi:uncharacterized protein YraI